jgi:2-polyprenyl-3-methyl-5-hydroxy-6-metoxy-1,4-benzoquinol methylase
MLYRTRENVVRRVREFVFDTTGMQKVVEFRAQKELEDCVGFGEFKEARQFQFDLLKGLGLKPSHSVLEIGCGSLTAGVPVISYLEPSKYVGIDVRTKALDLAWREVSCHGLSSKNPRLIHSLDFGCKELGNATFDFIIAFSVLYHLTDDILHAFFGHVDKRLGGICIANVNTVSENSTWSGFPFVKKPLSYYEEAAKAHGLQTDNLGTMADLGYRSPFEERANTVLCFQRSD